MDRNVNNGNNLKGAKKTKWAKFKVHDMYIT